VTSAARHERRIGLLQGTSLLMVIGAVGVLAVWLERAPAEAPELRITVAQLRSQAAELTLLQRELDAGAVTGMFARQHAGQLSKTAHDAFRTLASLTVAPELVDVQRRAIADGGELLNHMAGARNAQTVALEETEPLCDRLDTLERALRR
jgi:hypothetical protein